MSSGFGVYVRGSKIVDISVFSQNEMDAAIPSFIVSEKRFLRYLLICY